MSSFTAAGGLPSGDANVITARHRDGERALTDAGVPATFLRAAGFDYNILMWGGGIRDGGVIRAPYPDAALPIVDPADIAASAAAVLLADVPGGGTWSITGPERISVRDQAQILSELLGRELQVERISEDDAKRDNFPAATPDIVTTSVLETMGPAAEALEPSGDVQTLTGQTPRSFRQWATEHVAVFR